MKKIFTLILLSPLFLLTTSKAQITLDTTLSNSLWLGYGFKPVQISSTETKWYFADTLNNTFSLYNMDFSPFIMDITVPEPFARSTNYMQVLYISRTLFDCDSTNIEYAYYSVLNPNYRPFRVVRTDGTILLQRDSVLAPYLYGQTLGGTDVIRPIVNTSSGARLFLHQIPSTFPIYVYSLCGDLPIDIFDLRGSEISFVSIFPNPSSNSLNFRIEVPDNINQYELVVFDGSAQILQRVNISALKHIYSVDTESYSSGTYYYSLSAKNKTYQTGKFILTK